MVSIKFFFCLFGLSSAAIGSARVVGSVVSSVCQVVAIEMFGGFVLFDIKLLMGSGGVPSMLVPLWHRYGSVYGPVCCCCTRVYAGASSSHHSTYNATEHI